MADEIIGAVADTGDAAPVEDTSQAVVTTEAGGDALQVEGDQPADGTQSDIEASNAPIAEQVKGHLEELKKSNPALAKELKNLFFAQDAFKKEIPGGLPEVRQLKQTVEALGGKEGIEQIHAQRAEWKQIDEKFAAGDASVLDEFAKFNAEGYAKLIPAAVDKLAAVDRDSYNHMLAGPFAATLDAWRLPDTLERLEENLSQIVDKDGKQLCAREIQQIQQLKQRYDGIRTLADKAPVKKVDDESKKLADERTKIAAERAQVHGEYVATATQKHAEQQYSRVITAEAKNHGLDIEVLKSAGSYDRFMREIDQEIAREILKDKSAVEKIQNSIQAGRRDEAIKLSNAKFDAISGNVVQRVVKEWSKMINPKGVSAKPNGNGTGKPVQAGVRQLTEAPDTKLVDKTDPEWKNDYMMHSKAKLTTGQRVQW